jgi:hypothetical protein
MDKKKLFILIAAILIIIILIILGISSCEPRSKILTEEETYIAFINANIEFTCEIMKDPTLTEAPEELKEQLNNIYSKHFLPVDDDQTMIELLQKFENDISVVSIVQTNTSLCLAGGEPTFHQAVIAE